MMRYFDFVAFRAEERERHVADFDILRSLLHVCAFWEGLGIGVKYPHEV